MSDQTGCTSLTGGEAVVRALAAHGVTQAFGIPGTHNLEIYRHLGPYGIGHVAPRHEQGAGYAADAYARVTGRPGVAITTTGPALLNIAAAVGQAYSDSVPLLVVSPGMPLRHPRQATGLLHEMRSQTEALRGVAAFSHRVSSVEEIGSAVARAFALLRHERPRPVHVEVPLDLLEAAEPAGPVRLAPPLARPGAEASAVREAARVLRSAKRPALVLGGGARQAAAACLTLAELLGAPVVTTANGKGIVDERHHLALGVSLHSPAVQRWLTGCDAVLAIGTELAESDLWSAPPALTGTLIRVDLDPAQMYTGLPAGQPLVGDARTTLTALLTALTEPPSAIDPGPENCGENSRGSGKAARTGPGPGPAAPARTGAGHRTVPVPWRPCAPPGMRRRPAATPGGCRICVRYGACSPTTRSSPPTVRSAATTARCRTCPSAPRGASSTRPASAPSATRCPLPSARRRRTRDVRSWR